MVEAVGRSRLEGVPGKRSAHIRPADEYTGWVSAAQNPRRYPLASIKLVREEDAGDDVRAVYDDIKATMGWSFVPETFQLMAHDVDHLRSTGELY